MKLLAAFNALLWLADVIVAALYARSWPLAIMGVLGVAIATVQWKLTDDYKPARRVTR